MNHSSLTISRRSRVIGISSTVIIACLILVAGTAVADTPDAAQPQKPAERLKSGPKVGSYVPSFYIKAVTGPLMNKTICYVCRNGQRPVVMLLLRRVDRDLKPLFKQLDRLVDENRAAGLRGFGVLVSEKSTKATSAVQTFAFNNKISLPLTVGGESVAAADNQNLSPDAALTVVLYRKRRVVKTWSYRAGELKPSDVDGIIKRIKRLIADDGT